MERWSPWIARWGSFATGVFIGLLIVGPVLAAPTDLAEVSYHLLQSLLALGSVAIIVVLILAAFAAARSHRLAPQRSRSLEHEGRMRR